MKRTGIVAMALLLGALSVSAVACKDASTEDTGLVVLASETEGTSSAPESKESQTSESTAASSETSAVDTSYHFEYKGVSIKPGMKADEVVSAIDDEYDKFEAESCAAQGLAITYTYGGGVFTIYTEDENNLAVVKMITIFKPDVATPEGIKVGDSREQVVAAYGEPTLSDEDSSEYIKDGLEVSFVFDEGNVEMINYSAEESEL